MQKITQNFDVFMAKVLYKNLKKNTIKIMQKLNGFIVVFSLKFNL